MMGDMLFLIGFMALKMLIKHFTIMQKHRLINNSMVKNIMTGPDS